MRNLAKIFLRSFENVGQLPQQLKLISHKQFRWVEFILETIYQANLLTGSKQPKLNIITTNNNNTTLNNCVRRNKLNQMKLKLGLGAFAIRPGNGLGQSHSCHDLQLPITCISFQSMFNSCTMSYFLGGNLATLDFQSPISQSM